MAKPASAAMEGATRRRLARYFQVPLEAADQISKRGGGRITRVVMTTLDSCSQAHVGIMLWT